MAVSIHAPPRGERQTKAANRCGCCGFDPRPPRRATAAGRVTDFIRGFDPRSPARGSDRQEMTERYFLLRKRFDPRSPHGEGDRLTMLLCTPRSTDPSFDPRSRTGSDVSGELDKEVVDHEVSIHAPARGARRKEQGGGVAQKGMVSIHAPARGATRPGRWVNCNSSCFDPRSRTGSDARLRVPPLLRQDVSIHAPARGARRNIVAFDVSRQHVSIHAPARGATCDDTS